MSNPEPPSQVVTTAVEPAAMSPLTRWTRTALQVLAALIVAVPTAAAAFNVSAETSAKFVGYMGGIVALVSALHNAFNASQSAPAQQRDVGDARVSLLLRIIALGLFLIAGAIGATWITSDYIFAFAFFGCATWVLAELVP